MLAVGDDVGQIFAEVGRDDDCGVAVARLHRFHCVGFAHELPAELVVALQRAFDLITEIDFAKQRVVCAFVHVGHGHFDAVRVAIGIPEPVDVEPCV